MVLGLKGKMVCRGGGGGRRGGEMTKGEKNRGKMTWGGGGVK